MSLSSHPKLSSDILAAVSWSNVACLDLDLTDLLIFHNVLEITGCIKDL